jgi:outer membrane lipoprotein SlyB
MKTFTAAALAAFVSLAQAQPSSESLVRVPTPQQLERLCDGCAWVQEVRTEEREGKGSGLGAVGGAVVGGLLGNQVGGGSGKKLATVGGAVAGGVAGNAIEKNSKKRTVWIVQLVNRDGTRRSVELGDDPHLRPGDKVVERDGQLSRP